MSLTAELTSSQMKCPFCKETFMTTIVTAYQPKYYDSDLHPHAEGFDDLLLTVHQCPSCKGCFFQDEHFLRAIKNIDVTRREFSSIYSLIDSHQFPDVYVTRFLFCSYLLEKHSLASRTLKAYTWHQAAWAARVRLNPGLEKTFIEKTLEHYLAILNESSHEVQTMFSSSELQNYLPFIIGEISRRLSYFDQAIIYFQKVKDQKLSNLARKLSKLASEGNHDNQVIELV